MPDFDDSQLPAEFQPDICPMCGGDRMVILFGMLSGEAWRELGDAIRAGRVLTGGCITYFPYDPHRICSQCRRGVTWFGQVMREDDVGNWVCEDPEEHRVMWSLFAKLRGVHPASIAESAPPRDVRRVDANAAVDEAPEPVEVGGRTVSLDFEALDCQDSASGPTRSTDTPLVVTFSAPLAPRQPWATLVRVLPDGAELTFVVRGKQLRIHGLLRGSQATTVVLSKGIAALDGRATRTSQRLDCTTRTEAGEHQGLAAVNWGPPILEAQLGAFYPLLAAEDDAVVEAAPLPGLVRPGENQNPRDELPWRTVYSGRLRETLRQPWRVAIDLRPLLPNALGGVVALRGSSGSWARRVLVSDTGVLVLRAESRARIWLRSLSTGEPVGSIGSSVSAGQPNVPPCAANLVDWPSDLEQLEIATPEALVTAGRWQTRRYHWRHQPRHRGHLRLASPVVLAGGVVQVLGWMLAEGGATDAPAQLHWSLEVGRRQVAAGQLPWGQVGRPGAAAVALLRLPPRLEEGSLLLKAGFAAAELHWEWQLRRAERAPWSWAVDPTTGALQLILPPGKTPTRQPLPRQLQVALWPSLPPPRPLPVGQGRHELADPHQVRALADRRRCVGEWHATDRPEDSPKGVVQVPLRTDGTARLKMGDGYAVVGVAVGKKQLGVRLALHPPESDLKLTTKAICVAPGSNWRVSVSSGQTTDGPPQLRVVWLQTTDPLVWDPEVAPQRILATTHAVTVATIPLRDGPLEQTLDLAATHAGRYRAVVDAQDGKTLAQIDLFAWEPGADIGPYWDVDRPDVQPLSVDESAGTIELLVHSPLRAGLALVGWETTDLADLREVTVSGHVAHLHLPLPADRRAKPALQVVVMAPRLALPDLRPGDPGRPRSAAAGRDLFGHWQLGQPCGTLEVERDGEALQVRLECTGHLPEGAAVLVWAVPEALFQAELPLAAHDGELAWELFDNRWQLPPRRGFAELAVPGVRPAFWPRHAPGLKIPQAQRPAAKPDGWVYGHSDDYAAQVAAADEVYMRINPKLPPDLGPVAWPAELPAAPWPVLRMVLEHGSAQGELACLPAGPMGWRVRAVVQTHGEPLELQRGGVA